MDGFDHILNWKLKAGSHQFPGPDGGTCINEAALVAAGFSTGLSITLGRCRGASRARFVVLPCG